MRGESAVSVDSYRVVYATCATVLIRSIVTEGARIAAAVRVDCYSLTDFEVRHQGADSVHSASEFVAKSQEAFFLARKRSLENTDLF